MCIRDSTHVADYHAGVVVQNTVLKGSAKVDYDAIPHVIFTDPEIAHVGLTDTEATKQRHKIRVLRWSYADNDRAHTEQNTRGHIKVVTNQDGGILGTTIVGTNAGELISLWTLAIAQRINIRDVARLVVPYPTLADIGKRAAGTYLTSGLTRSGLGRIMGFLRLRG